MKLEYYGGNGYGGVREIGLFKVQCRYCKIFRSLSEARKFYNSLNKGKSLWDVKAMKLLECHMEEQKEYEGDGLFFE